MMKIDLRSLMMKITYHITYSKYQKHKIKRKIFTGPKNNDFKSNLAFISGVVKSGKINITKACKNLGPKKLGC